MSEIMSQSFRSGVSGWSSRLGDYLISFTIVKINEHNWHSSCLPLKVSLNCRRDKFGEMITFTKLFFVKIR